MGYFWIKQKCNYIFNNYFRLFKTLLKRLFWRKNRIRKIKALFCYKLAHCEYTHVYVLSTPLFKYQTFIKQVYTQVFMSFPITKIPRPKFQKKTGSKNEFCEFDIKLRYIYYILYTRTTFNYVLSNLDLTLHFITIYVQGAPYG